jgi:epoxide hydrolase-like predicted phosphatase
MTTARSAPLPAIVWDMGGVMYRYFTEVMLEMAAEAAWDLRGVPMGPTGPVVDTAYECMQEGEIDEHEYLDEVRRRLAAAGHPVDPVEVIDWSVQTRAEVWSLIESVHEAGHPQAVLTNDATRWLGDRWWETWPPARWFDEMIDVASIGVRKPAAAPYLAATEVLDLAPRDCVFVDDMLVNCRGAEAVGMVGHWVDIRDPAGAMDTLAKRLELST